jgi:predicted amidohydrolase YtcJ
MSPAETTIFAAREIVTMNPSNPAATHVAVRDGRILGAGTLDELAGPGRYTLDDTFGDKVLVPGLIEAHSHAGAGAMWAFPYAGYFDRRDPDGKLWPGIRSTGELIDRLAALNEGAGADAPPLIVWGFDPIYFSGARLTAADLDRASAARRIFVFHANSHVATVNTAVLRACGITRDTQVEGVVRGADGEPSGELQEFAAMLLARDEMHHVLRVMAGDETGIRRYGRAACNAGCTTVAELGTVDLGRDEAVALWRRTVDDPSFAPRAVLYAGQFGGTADAARLAARVRELRGQASGKLRFGGVKLWLDGSIQGFTARLAWPGYYNGVPNGIWIIPPDQFPEMVRAIHRAGVNLHVHCNGEEPVDVFCDAVEAALREHAWLDHRHTVQHCQLTTAAQYRRMARLGMCANLFANHLWYWGDQHYETTVGPERARRLEACATAGREGVRYSLHSDAHVTPLGQLHTMWCAVNRVTPKGRVLGAHERVPACDALRAVTVDAAYQLRLDHEIGSIECGKRADFTVLDASPLDVAPMAIRDIPVWGTVVGGVKYEAARG